jgi:hypothetical protein
MDECDLKLKLAKTFSLNDVYIELESNGMMRIKREIRRL